MTAPSYQVSRSLPVHRIYAVGLLIILAALVAMPWWGDRADMRLATEMASYLALATMWNLLAGYAGVMSIGQQAFIGVGGYAVFVMAGMMNVPLYLAVLLAGVVALILAIPSGLILFRLRGAYFAVGSWVLAEIFLHLVSQSPTLGGGSGLSFPVAVARGFGSASERAAIFWWLAMAVAVLSVTVTYFLLRSPRGLALMAIRDNEVAASTLGVDTLRNKLLVYLVAAFVTGLVGAVVFLVKLRIAPVAAFDVNEWTANIIFIVVIGGLGYVEGAIVGTIVFFLLRAFLADLGAWYLIILGAIAIAVMIKAPGGIWGVLHNRFHIELFPLRRRVVPGDQEHPPEANHGKIDK